MLLLGYPTGGGHSPALLTRMPSYTFKSDRMEPHYPPAFRAQKLASPSVVGVSAHFPEYRRIPEALVQGRDLSGTFSRLAAVQVEALSMPKAV